jgi:hypothetical protein
MYTKIKTVDRIQLLSLFDSKTRALDYVEFSKFKKGHNSVKIHVRIICLWQWSPMLSNKCVQFQPICFSSFGDTNLHIKTKPTCDADICVGTIADRFLRIVELKNSNKLLVRSTIHHSKYILMAINRDISLKRVKETYFLLISVRNVNAFALS